MAYNKTEWKARKGSNLNRFEKSLETPGSVILHNAPQAVTEPGTPFSVDNMNKIEQGIFDAHEAIAAAAQADNAIHAILNDLTGLPAWDAASHVLLFTARNGATLEVDLPLESLAKDIDYDPAAKEIIITKLDGAEIRISVSDLVDVYTGSTGTHIQVEVDGGNVIKAKLLAGTVGETELAAALLAKINGKPDRSELDALQLQIDALTPEGWGNIAEQFDAIDQALAGKAPKSTTLTDVGGSSTLPPTTEKELTELLQITRNCLKWLVGQMPNKAYVNETFFDDPNNIPGYFTSLLQWATAQYRSIHSLAANPNTQMNDHPDTPFNLSENRYMLYVGESLRKTLVAMNYHSSGGMAMRNIQVDNWLGPWRYVAFTDNTASIVSPNFTGFPTISGNRIAAVTNTTDANATVLAVGEVVVAQSGSRINRNTQATIRLATPLSSEDRREDSYLVNSGSGTPLEGTWRACGNIGLVNGQYQILFRRVV